MCERSELLVIPRGLPRGTFIERRSPSDRAGTTTKESEKMRLHIDLNLHVPGFRYLDEETAEEVQARSGEALRYLEGRAEQNITVRMTRMARGD